MGDDLDQALAEITDCFERWREPLASAIGDCYVGARTNLRPEGSTPWEEPQADRACWNLVVTVNMQWPETTTRAVGDILRLLHAASTDADVLHALISPRGGCRTVGDCAFCKGDVRPLAVELEVQPLGLLRNALFAWDEGATSDAYRRTLEAIHRANALLRRRQFGAPRAPAPLEIALALGDVRHAKDDVGQCIRELDLLLAQCREWNAAGEDDNTPFRFVKMVYRGSLCIPMLSSKGILTTIAHSGFPTQFSIPSFQADKKRNREWVRVMIGLLCDSSTTIVGIRIPPTGPSRELLEQLCSGLRNNTKLRHLSLEWDLSPASDADAHRAEVEMLCLALFSKDTMLQLDFLGLSVSGISDNDRKILDAFAGANLQLDGPRFAVVKWETHRSSSDCTMVIAKILANCGVREVHLSPPEGGNSFKHALALVQGCESTLESMTDTYFCCRELKDDQQHSNWPRLSVTSRLTTLKLRASYEQIDVAYDTLRAFLSRVGANLRVLELTSSPYMEFGKEVAELILDACPRLDSLAVAQAGPTFKAELADAYASGRCHIKVLRFWATPIGHDDSVINMLCDRHHRGTSIVERLEHSQDWLDTDAARAVEKAMVHRLVQCNTRLEQIIVNGMTRRDPGQSDALMKSRTIQLLSLRRRWAFLSVLASTRFGRSSDKKVAYPDEVIELILGFAGQRKRRVVQTY